MSEFDPAEIRVGDAEREDALRALGEHLSAGRLDIDEYGERTAKVAAAKTRGELLTLFADLPAPRPDLSEARPPDEESTGSSPVQREIDRVQREAERRMAAALARRREQSPAERALGALVPLSFIVAVVLLITLKVWLVLLIPVAVGMIGGAIIGPRGRRPHGHRHW